MRTLGWYLGWGVVAVLLSGCGDKSPPFNNASQRIAGTPTGKTAAPARSVESRDMTPHDGESPAGSGVGLGDASDAVGLRGDAPRTAATAEAMVGTERTPRASQRKSLPAGILTAGSFDDNLEPRYFLSFVSKQFGQRPGFSDLANKLLGQRTLL